MYDESDGIDRDGDSDGDAEGDVDRDGDGGQNAASRFYDASISWN